MKTAYKFESKHLGKAFMEELKGMGYEQYGSSHWDIVNFILNHNAGLVQTSDISHYGYNEIELETQWNEALAHARGQLKPELKFFDWDVEKDESGITFAPKCEAIRFDKETLNTIVYALNFVYDKTVQEVIDELNKIL